MSIHHYPSTMRRYVKARRLDKKAGGCSFCLNDLSSQIVRETSTLRIIKNRTKYDLFEAVPVTDHLMVVPKEHREQLVDFTDTERQELLDICAEYEVKGYHFFGRGYGAITRSVAHQHTHLIKITDKPKRAMLYIDRLRVLLVG